MPRLVSNLGNLHNVLLHGLDSDHADIGESIRGILVLSTLNLTMNHGLTPLMLQLPEMLAKIDDPNLHGHFVTEALRAMEHYTLPDPDKYIDEAVKYFQVSKDLDGEGEYRQMSTDL
jgi:hypothetical protein